MVSLQISPIKRKDIFNLLVLIKCIYIFQQFDFINLLIQMISRILTKTIFPVARLCVPASIIFNTPKFNFGKIEKATKIKSIIDE